MVLNQTTRRFGTITTASLVACVVVSLLLAAGFFGNLHPALDAVAHFRVHVAVLLIIVALPLFATMLLKAGALAVLFGIMAIASTSGNVPLPGVGVAYGPLYPPSPEMPVYSLLQLNLRYDNSDRTQALSLIGRVKPDVMTLNEVSASWAESLKLIDEAYPYSLFCPYPNAVWGVAIMSRRPFVSGTTPECDQRGAFGVASFDFGGVAVEVATVHLAWPWPFEQSWQIDGLVAELGKLGATTLLAGDLNATPWSHAAARIAAAGRLTLMPSPGATWLKPILPEALRFAGLPIDNVFATESVMVHGIGRLGSVGSDHVPLLVQFSLHPGASPRGSDETATAQARPGPHPQG